MREQQKENKKQKLTLEIVEKMLKLTQEEMEHAKNLLTIGYSPAKIRDNFLKKRKEEEKAIQKANKEQKEKEEIAQKAIQKAENAKKLYADLQNLPTFENFKKVLFTIVNTSKYNNFKGKKWKVYGIEEEQGEKYIVTKEYTKDNKFDLICAIPLEDVIFENGQVKILDYEKDECLPMSYELTDNF